MSELPNIKINMSELPNIKIDKDISSVVKDYLRDFNNNTTEDLPVPPEISNWVCLQIQLERNRWLEKVKVALHEVDVQRRSALNYRKTIQETFENLRTLLQGFDVKDDVLFVDSEDDLGRTIPKYVEILTDICQSLMEERFQCQEILGLDNNGINLAVALKEAFRSVVGENRPPKLESENQELSEELNNLKNLLHHKQKDLESLQKQLRSINDVIDDQTVHSSDKKVKVHKEVDKTDGKGHDNASEDKQKTKTSEPKVKFAQDLEKPKKYAETTKQLPKDLASVPKSKSVTTLTVRPFEVVPTVSRLDTRESRSDRPYSERSITSYSRPYSEKSVASRPFSEKSIASRPYSEKSVVSYSSSQPTSQRDRSYIQISEDKLRALKIQAKKLETSLHDAISSMDKFNKKCHIGDQTVSNSTSSINVYNTLARNNRRGDYSSKHLIDNLKVASWKKNPFEVHGSRTNLPRAARPKRSLSEGRKPNTPPIAEVVDQSQIQGHLSRPAKRQGPVAKCFRCQNLFRKIDNHKLACCYHPKPKERFEKYNNSGQLLRVMYVWQCCRQEIDSPGCSFGHHI